MKKAALHEIAERVAALVNTVTSVVGVRFVLFVAVDADADEIAADPAVATHTSTATNLPGPTALAIMQSAMPGIEAYAEAWQPGAPPVDATRPKGPVS